MSARSRRWGLAAAALGAAFWLGAAAARAAAPEAAADADEAMEEPEEAAEAPAPKPAASSPKVRRKAPPAASSGRDQALKSRMNEIARIHKEQMAFAAAEMESFKQFWTKMRDERGLFEMRLSKQRENFLESLRSLDASAHGQSLLDFENMQANVMSSFEESATAKISAFVSEREARLREFGSAQELERQRVARLAADAWEEEKRALNLEVPTEDQVRKAKKERKEPRKGKDRKGA